MNPILIECMSKSYLTCTIIIQQVKGGKLHNLVQQQTYSLRIKEGRNNLSHLSHSSPHDRCNTTSLTVEERKARQTQACKTSKIRIHPCHHLVRLYSRSNLVEAKLRARNPSTVLEKVVLFIHKQQIMKNQKATYVSTTMTMSTDVRFLINHIQLSKCHSGDLSYEQQDAEKK